MANIYARETALKNVAGRSDYISNNSRQEEIVLHKQNMQYSWQDYIDFEKQNKKSVNENIQARETVIALPNDLYNDKKELEAFCDALGKKLYGSNRDYEYAVHWNSSRTNLHAHFIYSERERNQERQPKRYKRDIWADSKTGRTCKKESPNAVLRCKKGEIQKDKEGNIKYDDNPFTAKDKKFNNKNWLSERNKLIQAVFSSFKHDIDIFDRSTQIAQKKLSKGASDEFKGYVEEYNQKARMINSERKVLEKAQPLISKLKENGEELNRLNRELIQVKQREGQKRFLEKFFSQGSEKIKRFQTKIHDLIQIINKDILKVSEILGISPDAPSLSIQHTTSSLIENYKKRVQNFKTAIHWIKNNSTLTKYRENKPLRRRSYSVSERLEIAKQKQELLLKEQRSKEPTKTKDNSQGMSL